MIENLLLGRKQRITLSFSSYCPIVWLQVEINQSPLPLPRHIMERDIATANGT